MGIRTFFQKLFGKKDAVTPDSINGKRDDNGKGTRIVCVECRSPFVFRSGEQEFFKMRGLTPPKRCPSCRSKRKRRR